MNNVNTIFDEIIKEASTGFDEGNNLCLPLLFQTYEMNYAKLINKSSGFKSYPNLFIPNLIIIDRKKLDNTLTEFIKSASLYYENETSFHNLQYPIKSLLCSTLHNTMLNEFDDIRTLFLRYLNFFKIDRLKDFLTPKDIGVSKILCGNIIIGIAKEGINSSSPISFHISIEKIINDKLYYYDFPCIRYGISKDVAYIFEIEDVEKRKNKINDAIYEQELDNYQTTIDNLISKSIKTKEINYKNIFVLSALIILLNQRGIKEIIVPTVNINKYNGLEISYYNNLKKLNNIYDEATLKEDTKVLESTLGKMSFIKEKLKKHSLSIEKNNIALIKNFKFIEEVCLDYKIYDYPMQKDTNLHFYVVDNSNKWSNKLLEELSSLINNENDNNLLK